MDTRGKLLLAAAQFIREMTETQAETPRTDIMVELMAEACEEAAHERGKNGAKPVIPVQLPLPPVAQLAEGAISDDNVRILLRAGGYEVVRQTPLKIYGFLLRNTGREWTPSEVAKRIKLDRHICTNQLANLARRKIIVRLVDGHRGQESRYRAS